MSVTPYIVEFPYVHSTGPALSRFLTALRDDRVIWGRRCEACDMVVVPPEQHCDTCGGALGEWTEVGPGGALRGFTVVTAAMPLSGMTSPFAFVRVRLDGAGTDMVHVAARPERLVIGRRVRAVWASDRTGSIRDIAGFEAVE